MFLLCVLFAMEPQLAKTVIISTFLLSVCVFLLKVDDLKAQLEDSERRKLELEAQLSTAGHYQQQVCKSVIFN